MGCGAKRVLPSPTTNHISSATRPTTPFRGMARRAGCRMWKLKYVRTWWPTTPDRPSGRGESPALCRKPSTLFWEQPFESSAQPRNRDRTFPNRALVRRRAEVQLHLGRGRICASEPCREGSTLRLFLSYAEGQCPAQ